MSEDPQRQALTESIGEALIEWSRVEYVWANIFRDLLFGGIGDTAQRDPETGQLIAAVDSAEKSERADALFFAQKNSQYQFRLIGAVGKVSLAGRHALLTQFETILAQTKGLAEKRNKIAHAYYDSRVVIEDGQIQITPIQMLDFGRFKRAPNVDIVEAAEEFALHADDVYAFWESILSPSQ